MPLLQAVSDKRCISCERWHGRRKPASESDAVEVESDATRGLCIHGPWHRSIRGVRNACGHWLRWSALPDAAPPPGAEARRLCLPCLPDSAIKSGLSIHQHGS